MRVYVFMFVLVWTVAYTLEVCTHTESFAWQCWWVGVCVMIIGEERDKSSFSIVREQEILSKT